MSSRISDIKRAQKASLLLRVVSNLFLEAIRDNANLDGLFITRVELSPDKGMCYVFFFSPEGEDTFKEKLHHLKLYKPSLRASLAREVPGRYTPDILFKYDSQQSKVTRIDELLNKVKEDGDLD